MPDQSDNPPSYTDRPIGIDADGTRTEFDSLGTVEVPANRYWGAQTQRSFSTSPSATTTCRSRCTGPTACQEGLCTGE